MSDLLKESIADAKAVRETALANAKTFLEENFASSMKQMFAEKLKEEMTDGTEDSAAVQPIMPEDDMQVTSEELDEILAELENDGDMIDPMADPMNDSEGAGGMRAGHMDQRSGGLDEILAELESEISETSDDEDELNLEELLAELDADGQAVPDPVVPAVPAVPVAAVPAAVPAHYDVGIGPRGLEVPVPVVGQVQSPMAEEDDVTAEEMAEALVAINEENGSLKKQLSESLRTVKFMQNVLTETNLLNAKLLYTNKLFKCKSLNESQKLKIINTFDLTKNIREVKLAYTVLAESFNSGASVVKKKINTTAQAITEGLASKQVSSTRPASTIVDPQADVMTSRFQKLAGITK